jgi:GxxExxY protein
MILGCTIEVCKQLGPGLSASAYQESHHYELIKSGLKDVVKQKPMPMIYKDPKLDHGNRVNLLVNHKVVIEIKTVEQFTAVHPLFN